MPGRAVARFDPGPVVVLDRARCRHLRKRRFGEFQKSLGLARNFLTARLRSSFLAESWSSRRRLMEAPIRSMCRQNGGRGSLLPRPDGQAPQHGRRLGQPPLIDGHLHRDRRDRQHPRRHDQHAGSSTRRDPPPRQRLERPVRPRLAVVEGPDPQRRAERKKTTAGNGTGGRKREPKETRVRPIPSGARSRNGSGGTVSSSASHTSSVASAAGTASSSGRGPAWVGAEESRLLRCQLPPSSPEREPRSGFPDACSWRLLFLSRTSRASAMEEEQPGCQRSGGSWGL